MWRKMLDIGVVRRSKSVLKVWNNLNNENIIDIYTWED